MTEGTTWPESSRQELASFLAILCEDLDTIISLRGYLFAPVPGGPSSVSDEILYLMSQAWDEARSGVRELVSAALYPSGSQATALVRAGLTGAQLEFKVAAWRNARRDLLEAFGDSDDPDSAREPLPEIPEEVVRLDPPLARKRPRFRKWALKKLSQVLGHSDTILESFASAVALGHAVEEIKKVTERLSNDWSDALPEEKR